MYARGVLKNELLYSNVRILFYHGTLSVSHRNRQAIVYIVRGTCTAARQIILAGDRHATVP